MKKCNVFKALGFVVGACAAVATIGLIKKKLDEEKKKESEIEAEITAILEEKFAQIEAEEEQAEEA